LPVLQPDIGAYISFRGFRIAGHFVAYVQTDSFPEERDESVWSVNVATGKRRWYRSTNSHCAITRLALNRSGSVAYIDKSLTPYIDNPKPPALHVYLGVGGRRFLLDSGDDIDPASVAIVGSEVHWVRAGQPRSAPL
jgi:hypothetical protein